MQPKTAAIYTRCLPVKTWLKFSTVREVERRLRDFGLSQRQAKRAIHRAKNRD